MTKKKKVKEEKVITAEVVELKKEFSLKIQKVKMSDQKNNTGNYYSRADCQRRRCKG